MKYICLLPLGLVSCMSLAQDISMPKSAWLKSLSPMLTAHLCADQSPFLKGYKGDNCAADVASLFNKCTTEVKNVKLPDPVTSLDQANKGGQIIAECINAHYHGGQLLQIFNLIQKSTNQKHSD